MTFDPNFKSKQMIKKNEISKEEYLIGMLFLFGILGADVMVLEAVIKILN